MTHLTSSTDDDISAQAAEWLVLLDDDPNEQTQQQFALWLAQDPRHVEAIERMQNLLGEVEQFKRHYQQHQISKKILNDTLNNTRHYRLHFAYKSVLALFMVSALIVFFSLQYAPLDYWTADKRNTSQSWQQQQLPDHSQIKMSGKTAYNIDYDQHHRQIELLQGNILVDVAKDPSRPFLVKTTHGTVRALGTRFIVTQDGQHTIVTMLESKTLVWSTTAQQQPVSLIAGQRIEIGAQGLLSRKPIQINSQLFENAWQSQMLVANGESLTDVLDYLAMYYPGKILFDRQKLAKIQVTATLPLNHIDQALQQLAKELHLNVQNDLPYRIQITRQ
ncbi:DUF4880 domain-containing protein [Acinetobacter qingfengensis]|uniref:Uncharacterized protein n=1 Tax=Acinetobacter qingfengensis TaxID=1262585 RepID=A0A1E7RD44_9GAMM|nr:FecR domain-containing protein [Acinetobacter qingfengensis]KAA8732360.1 DUF4880 domain-containing protein [Acinetobacter qingfengensis]OEY97268.1 hypothetical protein BJI46_02285 [Acinetobacter qingfengensis]